jgi:phosphatidylglycerol:prolipoprotein diacylglycerol transferase
MMTISALLLSIKINIDPVIVRFLGLEITWHGLFTAVGVVAGVAVAAWLARRAGYQEDTIYNVALALVIGGIIGARTLYVLENLGHFKDNPGDVFSINTGGISIYGALIGGAIFAWAYAMIARLPNIPRAADIAAIGGIVGMAVGRIGDVINGEHFAKFTSLPWGVVYTNANSPSLLRFGPDATPQHPAVAYELIGDLFIFVILLLVYFRVYRAGVTFFAWVFLYGLMRTVVSFLRLDDTVLLGLRTAQLIGIATMPMAIASIMYLLQSPPKEDHASRAERRRARRGEAPTEEQPAG